jgi:hypothetical protein
MSVYAELSLEQRHAKLARNKRWQEKNPVKLRTYHRRKFLKKKYGLTLEAWETMFEAQGRKCASCGTTDPGRVNGWCTDHDHARIDLHARAILCNSCNVIAGYVNDSVEQLQAIIRYLERHKRINEL